VPGGADLADSERAAREFGNSERGAVTEFSKEEEENPNISL
jgi:hypothetical protein